ncbi:hypothetical protein BC831DRAFT_414136 [Entophlyctis helioformis]|nr:hypothetical protein BC831DRAFT_414136 [Entophlyctis helioformis]
MLLERSTFTQAHIAGDCDAAYAADGSYVLSGGADCALSLYATAAVRTGRTESPLRTNTTLHPLGITAVAVHGSLAATSCEDQHVRLIDIDTLEIKSTLFRSTLGVNHLAFSPNGNWLAIADEDGEAHLVHVKHMSRKVTLEGHNNAVKCVAFHPSGTMLLTSSADATIRMWSLSISGTGSEGQGDTAECVHVLRDVIDRCTPGSNEMCRIAWHPTGSHFAVCGKRNEVVVVANGSWNILYRLENQEPNSILEYSPNGMYLLTIGTKGRVRIWRPDTEKEIPLINERHSSPIRNAAWHPKVNELLMIDPNGKISYMEKVIPSELPHPVTGQETKKLVAKEPKTSDVGARARELEMLFGEIEGEDEIVPAAMLAQAGNAGKRTAVPGRSGKSRKFNSDSLDDLVDNMADHVSEDDGDEEDAGDDGADLNDFVVDDDGAGYIEDLKRPDELRRYRERSRAAALRDLEHDPMLAKSRRRDVYASHAMPAMEIQSAFQPGSTPTRGNKRYLAFNLLGSICSINADTHATIEVEYHDKSLRSFHFADHYNYTMAALTDYGAAFACDLTTTGSSTIFYRSNDIWATKGDWTIKLDMNESAKVLAMTKTGVVVATDMQYLRFFSYGGVQTYVRSVGGPILTMAGQGNYLFVVYHSGGTFHGDQNLSFILMDVEKRTTILRDRLPMSPSSTLEWTGFSDTLVPLTYDSAGVVRGLFLSDDASWIPILDTRIFRGTKTDHYWALGVSEDQFMCVVCKSDKYPQFPKPLINEIKLQVPFAQLEAPSAQLEEEWFRKSLLLRSSQPSSLAVGAATDDLLMGDNDPKLARERMMQDKTILQLIQAACGAEKVQRALDLCAMLHQLRSVEGAIKIAVHLHLPSLAERMNSIKEAKYLKEKQRQNREMRLARSLDPYEHDDGYRGNSRVGSRVHHDRDPYGDADAAFTASTKNGRRDRDRGRDIADDFDAQQTPLDALGQQQQQQQHDQVHRRSDAADARPAVKAPAAAPAPAPAPAPTTSAAKKRNPFAITNPDSANSGGGAKVPHGGGIFDAIAQAAAIKQQEAAKTKKPAADVQPTKRKQMTLFGIVSKPTDDPENAAVGGDGDAKKTVKKARNDTDTAMPAVASGSKIAPPATLDKFAVQLPAKPDQGIAAPQSPPRPANGNRAYVAADSDSDTGDANGDAEMAGNGDETADKENAEPVVVVPRRDKGKAPADPSTSLKTFLYQR